MDYNRVICDKLYHLRIILDEEDITLLLNAFDVVLFFIDDRSIESYTDLFNRIKERIFNSEASSPKATDDKIT